MRLPPPIVSDDLRPLEDQLHAQVHDSIRSERARAQADIGRAPAKPSRVKARRVPPRRVTPRS